MPTAPKISILIGLYLSCGHKNSVVICLFTYFLLVPCIGVSQYSDVSSLLGATHFTNGSPHGNGLSFIDFNKDGWDDLSFVGNNQQLQFLINNNGVLAPASFSIPNPAQHQINTLLWADYDNDGDLDLFISKQYAPMQLWQNDGNFNFINVAAAAGLEQANFFYSGAAFCDYDHDGCLDLYIGKFYHSSFNPGLEYRGMLYKSNCDGTFAHVTEAAGVLVSSRPIFQPVFLDFDNDGWEDLYLVTDRLAFPNELFKNNGDGTFTSLTTTSGAGIQIDSMSGTVGDYDNDGDLDIFVTNNPYPTGHVLLQNQGDGTFIQKQNEAGLYLVQVGWGSMWLDYDNDSWQDLFVSITSPVLAPIGNQFYVNDGTGHFMQQNAQVGLGGDLTETYTCAMGDLDNDGYYDFITNNVNNQPTKLYQNSTGSNNYFAFTLEGTISNKDGIGSWVHCYAGGNHYTRFTLCGENLMGQNSAKVIFGLGEIDLIDSLVINWNRGTYEVYYNLNVNQHLHFIEGITFSLPFDIQYTGDEFLCSGDSIVLDAGSHNSYLWNTGHTGPYLTVYEPGWYQVEVTNDFNLAYSSNPVIIEMAPEPEVLINIEHISCFGLQDGSISVAISNAPVQSINWNNDLQLLEINNLSSGIYSFIAYDSFGCQAIGSIEIIEPTPLLADAAVIPVTCHGDNNGIVFIEPVGGTPPYVVSFIDFNPEQLEAGVYEAIITDGNGCMHALEFSVTEPQPIEVNLNLSHHIENGEMGNAQAQISGGIPPYNITWSTGEQNVTSINNLESGIYSILVEDANACESQVEFEIDFLTSIHQSQSPELLLYPNPATDVLMIKGLRNQAVQIHVFNAQGQQVITKDITFTFPSVPSVSISSLTSGMYWIKLIYNNDIKTLPFMVLRYGQ
jgi:hypothetical protein